MCIVTLGVFCLEKNPEASMHFMEICRYHKFLVEEHFVTTADGYILRLRHHFMQGYFVFRARGNIPLKRRNMLSFGSMGFWIQPMGQW